MNEAEFEKYCEELSKHDRQKYILATMISAVPVSTTFPHGKTDLRRQLQEILFEEREHVLIKENFVFSPRYHSCEDIDFLLGGFLGFGKLLGLENWGFNFEYRTTPKILKIAGDAKRFFVRDEYEYLWSLGRKLKY